MMMERPTVVVSTASPYKFAASVLEALGSELYAQDGVRDEFEQVQQLSALTGTQAPAPIQGFGGANRYASRRFLLWRIWARQCAG